MEKSSAAVEGSVPTAIRAVAVASIWLAIVNLIFPGQCYSWDSPLGVVNRSIFSQEFGWIGILLGTTGGALIAQHLGSRTTGVALLPLAIATVGVGITTFDAVVADFNRIHRAEAIVRYFAVTGACAYVVEVSMIRFSNCTGDLVNRSLHALAIVGLSLVLGSSVVAGDIYHGGLDPERFSAPVLARGFQKLGTRDILFLATFSLLAVVPRRIRAGRITRR